MRDRFHRADAFQTISAALGVAAGPILLVRGAPAGWSFLLMAAGLVILAAQWMIVNDIELEFADRTQLLAAIAGVGCIAVAVVYLTRAASDLPSLFPGRDGDSEHVRIVPGIVTLTVGLAVFGRSLASLRPARAPR
jgi:hypothetical protein